MTTSLRLRCSPGHLAPTASLTCLTIANKAPTPVTPSKMPPWAPLASSFTQSPSFLEYQRRLQHTKGHNNAQTLLGVEQIPCDNQVRTLLDPLAPSYLDPVFVEVFEGLEQHRMLAHFRVLGDQLLVALDGTNYFSSQAIHCHNCLTRQLTNGQTLYYHAAITPVIVCPGRSRGHRLAPRVHHAARRACQTGLRTGRRANAGSANMPQQVAPHQRHLTGR